MPKKHTHLILEDRALIQILLGYGLSLRAIARKLQLAPSTITREFLRNKGRVPEAGAAPVPRRFPVAGWLPLYPCQAARPSGQQASLRPRSASTDCRGLIPGAVSIDERPIEVDERLVSGHWVGDLIKAARNQSQLGALVERKTLYTVLLHWTTPPPSTPHSALAFSSIAWIQPCVCR
jgi:IS30 family transposase